MNEDKFEFLGFATILLFMSGAFSAYGILSAVSTDELLVLRFMCFLSALGIFGFSVFMCFSMYDLEFNDEF